jgi:hypothetical protein
VRADGIRGALQLSNVSVFVQSMMQFDLYHLTSLAGWVESSGSSAAASMAAVKVPARCRQRDVLKDKGSKVK